MKTIGVRELKANLSRVLREVQSGEAVLVTDRGRVIAELRRPDAASVSASPVERALLRLAADGHVRLAEPLPEPYAASPLKSPAGTARDLLREDRDDR
jgi:antitoxin (DNA-binding transcriptional repressor) of toxin-antitoxin stability system